MSLIWRSRLIISGAAILAVWLGMHLAYGGYAMPAIFAAIAVAATLTYVARAPIDTLALGGVLLGYLVGNRGFAQLMPIPGVPLLPAEIVLLIAGTWVMLRCAFTHQLPFRRNALNGAILLWLAAGTIRVVFDVRPHGLAALRDYAMIYYAAFFFLAQHLAGDPRSRRFLLGTLLGAALLEPVAAIVSETSPGFLFNYLSVRGVPVILFKGDLAFTFMAVSAFLLAFGVDRRHRWWAWPIAALELLFVVGGANRASMLGALVALGWLTFSRARRFVGIQLGAMAAAFLLLAGLAFLAQQPWAEAKMAGVTERVRSLGDFIGAGTYESAESAMKGDNNRFRTMWWRAVVDETFAANPAFGLGFGHDLARNFLQEYNPEIEDFTARSPHSIIVTVIGRMGLVGLLVFACFGAALAARTWRAVRGESDTSVNLGLWTAAWVILISSCFGVVLEGPMAAVVFWSLLGIASAKVPTEAVPEDDAARGDPSLPEAQRAPDVVTTS